MSSERVGSGVYGKCLASGTHVTRQFGYMYIDHEVIEHVSFSLRVRGQLALLHEHVAQACVQFVAFALE
jgi:hypothetical protein